MMTNIGVDFPDMVAKNYVSALIGQFFKILPLKEEGEPTLVEFIRSLQLELIGAQDLIQEFESDGRFLELTAILQYLIDHEDCDTYVVRREVFKAINICKKLREKYCYKDGVV